MSAGLLGVAKSVAWFLRKPCDWGLHQNASGCCVSGLSQQLRVLDVLVMWTVCSTFEESID